MSLSGPKCRCGNKPDYFEAFPNCRQCLEPTCPTCTTKGSRREVDRDRESEDGTVAVLEVTVLCDSPDCLNAEDAGL